MNSSKQIKLGAVLSYVALGVNIVTGLLYTPWMVDSIGKSQYGLYTLANSLITLFLFDFGLSSATARYLSNYNAANDRAGAERFLGAVYKLYLTLDLVIFCVFAALFFLLDRIYVNLNPQELEQLRVVYAISAGFALINFPCVTFNGILTAYERFVPLKVLDLAYRLLNIGLTVAALLVGYGLYALVTVHAAVGLLVIAVKFGIIQKSIPLKADFRTREKGLYRDIFGFSLWVTVSTLALRLVFNITPSILGIVSGTAAIAVFGVVNTIEGYTYSITTAINGLFMPRISRILAGEDPDKNLYPLFRAVGRFQYGLNGLIVAGFAVVGRSFVELWMGADFQDAYGGILLVLVPGLFYNSLQIANTALIVANKVKHTAIICVVTGLVNVALSFPLSRILGVTGACLSICTAYFIRDILQNILCHRELPLDIPRFVRECYLRMSVPIVLTVLCGVGLNARIPDGGWGVFLVKAALTTALYLAFTYLFSLDRREKTAILTRLRR